ncbi:MAG TPA: methyl-accepting chemotaxis protein [Gemmatimonadales bacterium]|nr:methyl-accepting chemotaxis protein [Gemmatimonadales bacterium]
MPISVPALVRGYAQVLRFGGIAFGLLAVALDRRWLDAPVATALLVAAVVILRAAPIRLSKYSYLTQTGLAALAGAVLVGPAPVIVALLVGVPLTDSVLLRRELWIATVNAGREVLGFAAAFGIYAMVLDRSGDPGLTIEFLPAAFTLAAAYFLISRALFYFTLLVRGGLEPIEQVLILRWEIVSYLVTIIGVSVVVAAVQALEPVGWVAVLLLMGVLGVLTRRILEDAIAAEDLNKVHLMETALTGNITLQMSLEQIERLAYRLLEWGDFRIYRRDGVGASLVYRGSAGRPRRSIPSPELVPIRDSVLASGSTLVIPSMRADARIRQPDPDVQSLVIHPLRLGDEILGTVEVDHYRRNVYHDKDVAALATIGAQIATAIHIAELRRPLLGTVELIGTQVAGLARATESLRTSGAALTSVSRAVGGSLAEQEAFVRDGLDTTASLAEVAAEMAAAGSRAAEASGRAAETAAHNRTVVAEAIRRLVQLKGFVADSSRQVQELGEVSQRITGFIGTIREIADLTNLIALNAAIEAARAGREGKGFAVVADEIRDLAAQSLHAAREAGALLAAVSGQVAIVSGQMRVGETVVADVEEVSGAAAAAFDAIVGATDEAGDHARRVAGMAEQQELAFRSLTERIQRVAAASARMGEDTRMLSTQAEDAARGQGELEAAIRELGDVAAELQMLARHFAAER